MDVDDTIETLIYGFIVMCCIFAATFLLLLIFDNIVGFLILIAGGLVFAGLSFLIGYPIKKWIDNNL